MFDLSNISLFSKEDNWLNDVTKLSQVSLVMPSFCTVGFVAICRKDHTILLACSTLFSTCGVIIYLLIGLSYVFFVVMTAFVMEDHPKIVNSVILVNLVLGAAKFFIFACSIAVGLMIGTKKTMEEVKDNIWQSIENMF